MKCKCILFRIKEKVGNNCIPASKLSWLRVTLQGKNVSFIQRAAY